MGGETNSGGVARRLKVIIVGRNPVWTTVRLLVLIVGTFLVFKYVLSLPFRVEGISMLPTFRQNQINFFNRLAYFRHEPERGDVVGIRYSGEHTMLIKRIVGLPGESVSFRNGVLHINDRPMEEPYVKNPCDWNMPPKLLGADEYYVVGDNRSMPLLNHTQGAAQRQRIVGRVLFGGNPSS